MNSFDSSLLFLMCVSISISIFAKYTSICLYYTYIVYHMSIYICTQIVLHQSAPPTNHHVLFSPPSFQRRRETVRRPWSQGCDHWTQKTNLGGSLVVARDGKTERCSTEVSQLSTSFHLKKSEKVLKINGVWESLGNFLEFRWTNHQTQTNASKIHLRLAQHWFLARCRS